MSLSKNIEKSIIHASTTFSEDKLNIYKKAIETEDENNSNGKWALDLMIKNAEIAKKNKAPLCDDTGIPHVMIEIGKDRTIYPELFQAINDGISKGLKNLPGRPMAVKGNDIERIEQSKGLFDESEKMSPSSFLIDKYEGEKIKIHILLLGGGPEIRAKTYRVFHKRSYKEVLNKSISWLKEALPLLGCTPTIPCIGIGRSHFEANSLMIKSMVYGKLNNQSSIEKYVTSELNKTNIGPMGFGGKTTAIGTFIKIGPQRSSGVRIVSARPSCFVEPRIATVTL